ncbi:MAG: hypothetical protein J2P17_33735, partial [Mycobacterium sp.]|nr:hypothetical protein [Mycobacterium sp.]
MSPPECDDDQRTFLLQELRNLEHLRRIHANDLVVGLLLAAATRHVIADLAFFEDTEHTLLDDDNAQATLPVRDRMVNAGSPTAVRNGLPRRSGDPVHRHHAAMAARTHQAVGAVAAEHRTRPGSRRQTTG